MRVGLALIALTMFHTTLGHSQADQGRDSVAAELRELSVRVDSLERILQRMQGEETTPAAEQDELAALRRAARAVADSATRSEEPTGGEFVERSRNLNRLNPEISVTGDVRAVAFRPGPQTDNIDLREFEFSFQSALDPFASTKIFLSFEDGELDLEEAYAY